MGSKSDFIRRTFRAFFFLLIATSQVTTLLAAETRKVEPGTVRAIVEDLEARAVSREKKRLGISPFQNLSTKEPGLFGETLARELSSALSASRGFTIVTMDLKRLAEVLRGELSDLKDPGTRVRLGRLFGIHSLLTGTYRLDWTGTTIYADLLDLETGALLTVRADEKQAWFYPTLIGAAVLVVCLGGAGLQRRRFRRRRGMAEGYYAEAMGHYAEGRLPEAEVRLKEALRLNPKHYEAQVLLEKLGKASVVEHAPSQVVPPPLESRPPPPRPKEPPARPGVSIEEFVNMAPARQSFHIRVWTDNADHPMKGERLRTRDIKVLPSRDESRYRLGDRIVVYFASDRDCYLRLINIGPTGNLIQLFPNRYHRENFIRAGVIHSLPGPDYGGFEFRLAPPAGLETVKAIASTSPFTLPAVEEAGPFSRLSARDIQVLPAQLSSEGAWAEDFCRFFVAE